MKKKIIIFIYIITCIINNIRKETSSRIFWCTLTVSRCVKLRVISQFRPMRHVDVCKKSFQRNRTKDLRKLKRRCQEGKKKKEKNDIHIRMPVSCSRTVQQLRAALYQLHQREAAAVLQPPHVRPRTRRVYKRGHWVGLHRFWHGPGRMYRSDREGTLGRQIDRFLAGKKPRQTGTAGSRRERDSSKLNNEWMIRHENWDSC